MAESDDLHSDDELHQATKDGTIREGTARIHYKLFQKYGFLVPENPKYPGETIFFGLTAHVDASKKFIADLRDELKVDQRVTFMAVPAERDGSITWKALVIAPLPPDQQLPGKPDEITVEDKEWLTCKILPNLQPLRGFATPEGANSYHDNVYFSIKEASDGLERNVSDLTTVFRPGETIKALVVLADSRFKAKYKALKICKLYPTAPAVRTPSHKEDDLLVEEMDQTAVAWICAFLKAKGSTRLTSLAGNLSQLPEVRKVVQPQKKSVRKFLAKYPRFFNVQDDTVSLNPNGPSQYFTARSEKSTTSGSLNFEESNWSDSDSSSSFGEPSPVPVRTPSPVLYTKHNLKAMADTTSKFTASMLATIVKSQTEPMKVSELFRVCQHKGWEGMASLAMVDQIVKTNAKYFRQDDKSRVILTSEGAKLSVRLVDTEHTGSKVNKVTTKDSELFFPTSNLGTSIASTLPSTHRPAVPSSYSAFSSVPGANGLSTSIFGQSSSSTLNDSLFTRSFSDLSSGYGYQNYELASKNAMFNPNAFPTSSILPEMEKNDMNYENGGVYHSDGDDSFEGKAKVQNTEFSTINYTEDETRFLSTVAKAICPNGVGGEDEAFKMIKRELDGLGITQGITIGYGLVSRHLICIQFDVGMVPRAKFQHFTPSGKIAQNTVALTAEKVSQNSISDMLEPTRFHVKQVAKCLYGINKTFHCIRMVMNELDEILGCTISFRREETADKRKLGEKFGEKVRIIFTDAQGGTSPSKACAALKEYANGKSSKHIVIAVDTEGQIFGFGMSTDAVRRVICGNLDSQQYQLKEAIHHEPDVVVANSIDTKDSLSLLKRISGNGISVYAEVSRFLESAARKIFED